MIASKLQELIAFKPTFFEQDATKLRNGVLSKIGGVFQRAEAKNANGRVYPKQLWQSTLQDPDVRTRVENRRMVGMLGHPSSGQTDPEKISHVITKQELRSDNSVYGEAEVLDTPMGRIVDTLLRSGVGLGISSRGDGSVEKKGDHQEVKQDFKLETYDLVLKPSTPGAYPEMLSESSTVEDHEKLVAEAIEGLVNSEGIPEEQQLPVLTECLKILSVLEAKNSGNLVKTLSTKITEQLKEIQITPEVVLTIEARESEPEFNQPQETQDPVMEDIMTQNRGGAPAMAPDTLAWHQHAVRAAVRESVGVKEQEVANLKDTVIKAQREHTETRKRLKAAESLIEDFDKEVKRLRESGPSDKKLQRRYEAAVELLDEALKRLPEIGGLGRRCRTLEGLVQAGFDHIMEDRKGRVVKEHLARIAPAYHATVRPVLESCRTPEQVAETFKALVAVSGGTPTPSRRSDPLPRGSGRVNEERTDKTPKPARVQESVSYANLLGKRLSKAV